MASGRKKEFDVNDALTSAMEVFWAKGYIGASLSDLTESMGINKPSMYSAFGNKEALFIKTTQLYIENSAKKHSHFLTDFSFSLFERLKNYMMSVVEAQCAGVKPKGCYLAYCQAELVAGTIPEGASELLNTARCDGQDALVDVFKTDSDSIKLGMDINADEHALCLYSTLQGTASMARAGITYNELECVVKSSLRGIGLS